MRKDTPDTTFVRHPRVTRHSRVLKNNKQGRVFHPALQIHLLKNHLSAIASMHVIFVDALLLSSNALHSILLKSTDCTKSTLPLQCK